MLVEATATRRASEWLTRDWHFRRTAPGIHERVMTIAELDEFMPQAGARGVAFTVQEPREVA